MQENSLKWFGHVHRRSMMQQREDCLEVTDVFREKGRRKKN